MTSPIPTWCDVPSRPTVTVYTRAGCHLCEDAIAIVREVAAGRADVALVDIDADRDLYDRYTVRVPVIAIDGVEIAEYHVAREQLETALRDGP